MSRLMPLAVRAGLAGVLLAAVSLAAQAGEILRETFRSARLQREVAYTAYLPDGHATAAPLPVIYLLHGAGGDEWSWLRQGGAAETLDGLVQRGLLRPSLVVMPTLGPHTWWADGAVEAAESAFIEELLPLVERRFKVAAGRGARAIGGLSMGGHGALNLALRHPESFCGAALISPAIYDPLPPEVSSARRAAQFQRDGAFDPGLWRSLNYAAQLARYQAAPARVAMWIAAGDHDFLGIALQSAQLHWRLQAIQPRQVELRIVDGDHDWLVFRDALTQALPWVDRQCRQGG